MLSSMRFGHVMNVLSFLEVQDIYVLCKYRLISVDFLREFCLYYRNFKVSKKLCFLLKKHIDYRGVLIKNEDDKVSIFIRLFQRNLFFNDDFLNYKLLLRSLFFLKVINIDKYKILKSSTMAATVLTNFINLNKLISHNVEKLIDIKYMLSIKAYRAYYFYRYFDLADLSQNTLNKINNHHGDLLTELAHREIFGPIFKLSDSKFQLYIEESEKIRI